MLEVFWTCWSYLRSGARWIVNAFRTQSRIGALENKIATLEKPAAPSPHRKCPQCGERDFRLQDRYRFRYSPLDRQRYFHEKGRCYSCGHLEQVDIPEPGG